MYKLSKVLFFAVFLIAAFKAFADNSSGLKEFKIEQAKYQEYSENNQWENALVHSKKSYELGLGIFGEIHKNTAALADNYALNLMRLNKSSEAREILLKALKINEELYGVDAYEIVPILMDIGHLSKKENQFSSKVANYRRALKISKKIDGENSINYAQNSILVGTNLIYAANSAKGKPYLYDGYNILSKLVEPDDPRLGYAAFNIAKYEFSKSNYNKAIGFFNQTLDSYELPDRPSNKVELITHSLLVQSYEKVNKSDEATRHCLAIGRMTPFTNDQEYVPLMKIAPKYPIAAARIGAQGYVTIEYDVDEAGFVRNPRMVDLKGHKSFVDAGIEASKKFRYAPQFKSGKPVVTKNIKNRFTFQLSN